ncbi:MAG TPA: hypothetical protein VM327_05085 [Candidatus Thermoplasmatota archaeon]|nr:hypothetical protein [Candidatus Thermoplasmatota archaeon]
MRLPGVVAALAVSILSLAGCNGGDGGNGGPGGSAGADPSITGPDGSEGQAEAPDPADGFAVLVATGTLKGEGPPPSGAIACSIAAPNGHIDLDDEEVWAKPGRHSFKAGQTWLLVLDQVVVDDPRQSGCGVPTITPFTVTGNWYPTLGEDKFSLEISPDGDRLLLGRNAVEPDGRFETYVEFEDGEYTFSGNLTFTHEGRWPPSAFEERDAEVPQDDGAVWWH